MSNDGPLFDDEQLPNWLTNAGITGGGEKSAPQSSGQSSSTDSNTANDLNWLDDVSDPSGASNDASGDAAPWMQDAALVDNAGSSSDAPWMQDVASKKGSSPFEDAPSEDAPPWMADQPVKKGTNPFDEPTADEAPPWMQNSGSSQAGIPQPGQPGFGVTGMLPWRQETGDPEPDNFGQLNANTFDDQPQQTAWGSSEPAVSFGSSQDQPSNTLEGLDDFDWLDNDTSESVTDSADSIPTSESTPNIPDAPPAPPIAPPAPSAIRPIKPLTPPARQSEAPADSSSTPPPTIRRLPSAASQPPSTEQPTIRAIKPLQPRQEQPPAAPEPSAPDYSNMTYEEWDQQQAAAEAARANPESVIDEDLINAVPDWIAEDQATPAIASTEPEVIPDWFSGMEEQSAEDAPDWFNSSDLSGTQLVGPDSISTTFGNTDAVPSSPPSDEVPDWFKGATPDVDAIDFNAMFVSETPAEPEASSAPDQSIQAVKQSTDALPESFEAEQVNEFSAPDIAASAPISSISVDDLSLPQDFDVESQVPEPSFAASKAPSELNLDQNIESMSDLSDINFGDNFGSIEQPEATLPVGESSTATTDDDDLDWMSEMPDVDDLLSYAPPTSASQTIEAQPDPEPATSVDAMDWFGGEDAVVEDTTLDARGEVSESEEEQPAELAASNAASNFDALDWMGETSHEIAAASVSTEQPEDANWMDQLGFGDQTLDSTEPNDDVSATEAQPETEVPDWMAAMAPGAGEPQGDAGSLPVESLNFDLLEPAAVEAEADLTDFELSNWMTATPDTPAAESVSTSESSDLVDDGSPAWLREAPPTAPTPVSQSAAEPASSGAGEFDWLADFSNVPEIVSAESSESTAPVSEAPDWFTDIPAAPEFSMEELSQAETFDLPPMSEPVASTSSSSTTGSDHVDIDALLNLSLPPVSTPATSQIENQPAAHATDFDLDSVLGPADEALTVETPSSESLELMSANALSDSLANIFAAEDDGETYEQAQEGFATTAPAPTTTAPAGPKEVLPEWVSDMRPAEGPVIMRVGHQELRFQDQPLNQLPDKVRRLRERTKAISKQRPAKGESIASGPLAGVADALEVVSESIQPRIVIGDNSPLIVSDLDARRIKIIQNILGVEEQLLMERALAEDEREEKQARVGTIVSAPIRSKVKIDRFIVTILLALAIAAPFLLRNLSIMEAPTAANMTAAQKKAHLDVSTAINGLQAGKPVIIAFEYGPTAAGELDDLARGVLRDVIQRGAQPIIVSTNVAGIIHAQGMMHKLSTNPAELQSMDRADKPLIANQDYVILRYLPGGAIGVRSFTNAVLSSDFKQFSVQAMFQNDIAGRPTNLTDVSVVSLRQNPAFIITEAPEDVRTWIEQYKSEPPLDPLKLVLLSSASASAVSQTYASSAADRVVGPLVGLRDALIFQEQHQPLTEKSQAVALQRWNSMALATLLAALIILLGAAINVIRNLQRRISG